MSANRRRLLFTIALILGALGLLVLGRTGFLSPLQDLAYRGATNVQSTISTTYFNIRDFLTAPRNLQELLQQNEVLQAEVARLEREVVVLREQAAEAESLRALLGFSRQQPENRYLLAHVIGRDTNPFLKYVILDQGSDSGVQSGMPVVSEFGLVGRIIEVTATASKVQLITDPDSSINAKIEESQATGIVVGRSTGDLEMIYIPQNVEVKPGQTVVTSGLGGGFPSYILIGRVVSVHRRDYELYQTAIIEPRNDFSLLELILIITNFEPVSTGPLEQPNS